MAQVFISYSRKDKDFVQRLNAAFVNENRVVWVDWSSIPRGEHFWSEIQAGIEGAEAFIAVISESWLTSQYCHNELAYARENHKRILPLIRQRIEGDLELRLKGIWSDQPYGEKARANWDYLREINWIFFDTDASFEPEFAALLRTLDEDQPHIKAHTRYLVRALEWLNSGQNPGFLLAGDDLTFAEGWLAAWERNAFEGVSRGEPPKTPSPTETQRAYIAESRRTADDQQRRDEQRERRIRQFRSVTALLGVVGALAIITAVGASIVGVQAGQRADHAATNVADANATLTPIPRTLTPIGATLQAGQTQIVGAQMVAEQAQRQAADANATLTPIRSTLTPIAETLTAGETRIAGIPPTLDALATDVQAAQNFADSIQLAARARDVYNNGRNQPLGLALAFEAIQIDAPPRTERILTELAYAPGVRRLIDHPIENLTALAFSPDWTLLATASCTFDENVVCEPLELALWDAATGEQIHRLEGHTDRITALAFSPDRTQMVSNSRDQGLIVWDVAAGTKIRSLPGHSSGVADLAFSPNGSRLALGGDDGTLILLDATTGEVIENIPPPFEVESIWAWHLAFSPDNSSLLASSCILWRFGGCEAAWLNLHDANTGEIVHSFTGMTEGMNLLRIAFSDDATQILAGGDGGAALLWNITAPDSPRRFEGHPGNITAVAFINTSHLIAAGEGTLTVWETTTGSIERRFEGDAGSITQIGLSDDGLRLHSGASDGTFVVWDRQPADIVQRIAMPPNTSLMSVTFDPSGEYLVTETWNSLLEDGGSTLNIWNIKTGSVTRAFENADSEVVSAAFSPDGRQLASSSSDGQIRFWDVETDRALHQYTLEPQDYLYHMIGSLSYSPDSSLLLVSGCFMDGMFCESGELLLFDAATGEPLRSFDGHTDMINSAVFSPDGTQIVSGSSDGQIIVWETRTGAVLYRFEDMGDVSTVAFSPDGTAILSISRDGALLLREVRDGSVLRNFEGANGVSAAFSPDGTRIVSSSAGAVIVWDVATGEILRRFEGHTDVVDNLAFSPEGTSIVSGSADGTLIIWRNDTIEQLKAWVADNRYIPTLSCEEYQTYGIPSECHIAE